MRELRIFRILIILAGVMGADGVILAAAATHQGDAARLVPASSMLLFHAAAVLATVSLTERGVIHQTGGLLAAYGFVVAAALFAGDVSVRRADRGHAFDCKLAGACDRCRLAQPKMTAQPAILCAAPANRIETAARSG